MNLLKKIKLKFIT